MRENQRRTQGVLERKEGGNIHLAHQKALGLWGFYENHLKMEVPLMTLYQKHVRGTQSKKGTCEMMQKPISKEMQFSESSLAVFLLATVQQWISGKGRKTN